jgi:hypothetical protein
MSDSDRRYWECEREGLIVRLTAIERHKLKLRVTTSDLRLWLKRRGPPADVIERDVEQLKAKKHGREK